MTNREAGEDKKMISDEDRATVHKRVEKLGGRRTRRQCAIRRKKKEKQKQVKKKHSGRH